MENRFGFKDFVLAALLVILIAFVVLAMKQFDRQYEVIQKIDSKLDAQTGDIAAMRRALSQGVAVTTTAPTTQALTPRDTNDPFARIKAARAMPDFAEGGWLVDAFGGGIAKLTPLVSGDAYAALVQDSVFESLCTRDPDTLDWQGLLAESWKIDDRSKAWDDYVKSVVAAGVDHDLLIAAIEAPGDAEWKEIVDAKTKLKAPQAKLDAARAAAAKAPPALYISFHMRDGVVFSDGEPLTADDVVFSFNFTMDPKIDAPRSRAYLKMIRRVEKTGDRDVRFEFREPYFESFDLAAGMQVMPKHFYSKMKPEEFNQSVGYVLGSGAYKLQDPKSWKPGQLVRLVRNDRYWGTRSGYESVVYREITNDVARLTAFRNGDVDIFSCSPEQYKQLLSDPALSARTQHFEYESPIGGYRFIAWNEARNGKPTVFADKRVRQAMTLLINRDRMINEVMLGFAVQATGPFNPASKQYDTAIKPWPYDVERAKALLKDAGLVDRDGDGVLESPEGEPFRFKLTYPSGSSNYEAMALFLKDAYARAGIVMVPDPLEWSVFTDRLNNKNFEAISLAWTAGIETDIFQMFHSSQMIEGGDDFMSYKNVELDKLIDEARRTVDEDKRMPLWKNAHRILFEDQPYTFLFFPKSLRFVDNRVHNVQKIKLGLNPREEWFTPKELQRKTE